MKIKVWGVSPKYIKLWYKTVIEKMLLCAAVIWVEDLDPQCSRILAACQRHYSKIIRRSFTTASAAATQVLSGVMLIAHKAKYDAIIGQITILHEE